MIPRGHTSSKLIATALTFRSRRELGSWSSATPPEQTRSRPTRPASSTRRTRTVSRTVWRPCSTTPRVCRRSRLVAADGELATLSHNPNLVSPDPGVRRAEVVEDRRERRLRSEGRQHPERVHQLPPHRANILGDYNRVGIGTVRDGSDTIWVTVDFVKGPASRCRRLRHRNRRRVTLWRRPRPSWPNGRSDVFQRGSDGALWAKTFHGVWSPWYTLGGALAVGADGTSWGERPHRRVRQGRRRRDLAPVDLTGGRGRRGSRSAAASLLARAQCPWVLNRVDVFARGLDGSLWGKSLSGSIWGSWYTLGGYIASAPDVSSWGNGRLDVFAIGGDGSVWRRAFANGAWFGWDSLGGQATSGPGAVSWGSNRIDVFARGARRLDVEQLVDRRGLVRLVHPRRRAGVCARRGRSRRQQAHRRARGGDGFIWLKSLTASGWTGWYILG